MSNGEFKIEIYSIDPANGGAYTKVDEIRNFLGLSFASRINGAGMASFTMPGFSAKSTPINLRRYGNVIAIKYNGTILWTGFVNTHAPTYQSDNGVGFSISIECREFFAHFENRFTADVVRYVQTDAGDIAMALINYSQALDNGDLGIIEGTIEPTVDRDREYQKKSIYEAIIDLTNVEDGFDFILTPITDANGDLAGHTFNVLENIGAYKPNVPPLTLGGNVLGFSGFTNQEIINHMTIKGAGIGEDNILGIAENTASQISYTRREEVQVRSDISIQGTLEQHANEFITQNNSEVITFDLSIRPLSNLPYGAFTIGDSVNINLNVPEMNVDYSGIADIISIEANVDSQGVLSYSARVKLTL